MSGWRIVPVELTPEMWENMHERASYGPHKIHKAMLAAAPEWGPSEADVERGVVAYRAELTRIFDAADRLEAGDCYNAMRAALKAAFEEVEP